MVSLGIKAGIALAFIVIVYLVLKFFWEIDLLESLWGILSESLSEVEWNPIVLIVTIGISVIFWLILWKSPFWVTNYDCGRLTCINGPFMKVAMTVLLPMVAYPFALRAWNRNG